MCDTFLASSWPSFHVIPISDLVPVSARSNNWRTSSARAPVTPPIVIHSSTSKSTSFETTLRTSRPYSSIQASSSRAVNVKSGWRPRSLRSIIFRQYDFTGSGGATDSITHINPKGLRTLPNSRNAKPGSSIWCRPFRQIRISMVPSLMGRTSPRARRYHTFAKEWRCAARSSIGRDKSRPIKWPFSRANARATAPVPVATSRIVRALKRAPSDIRFTMVRRRDWSCTHVSMSYVSARSSKDHSASISPLLWINTLPCYGAGCQNFCSSAEAVVGARPKWSGSREIMSLVRLDQVASCAVFAVHRPSGQPRDGRVGRGTNARQRQWPARSAGHSAATSMPINSVSWASLLTAAGGVITQLRVRRLVCAAVTWPRRTFREQVLALAQRWARRTRQPTVLVAERRSLGFSLSVDQNL